ncbi:MAG: biotin/lipoyl-containing protein [Myxococcota bacterium]
MAKKRVSVMNTAFRDGFQSVYGARVRTADFLPALEAAKAAGFTHFEAGGGARFQSLYLYCQEDAFDMMDAFRATVGPEANLQTLARGVSVVGLDSQCSDVIDLHARLFKRHGMTTIRNFDALNDVRNLAFSGRCIANAGLRHEVVVTLMELPPGCEGAHAAEDYVAVLESILDDGVPFHSVCFKDASGTVVPNKAYDTIRLARRRLGDDVHIRLHTHETAGVSVSVYLAALEAGVDGIDLAMAPVSGGTSQPDWIVMWHALRGTEFDLGLDPDRVLEAEEVFKTCMRDYFLPPEATAVEPLTPYSPMPGGALTANSQMMRDAGTLDRLPTVIRAMGEVVRRGGFGTSVTPVSQFYFQQAYNNVIFGPWQRIAEGYGRMVLGYFGRTPVPPDPEVVRRASEQLSLEPTTRNPREIDDENPKKSLAHHRARLVERGLEPSDEALFIVSCLGDKGLAFLEGERPDGVRKVVRTERPGGGTGGGGRTGVDTGSGAGSRGEASEGAYRVRLGGRDYDVVLADGQATVNGRVYDYTMSERTAAAGASSGTPADESASRATATGGAAAAAGSARETVRADLAGQVKRIVVHVGDAIAAGDVVVLVEALKMEIELRSPVAGTVTRIRVHPEERVEAGDILLELA